MGPETAFWRKQRRARSRRAAQGVSLVEVLIVVALLALGGIVAARSLQHTTQATAEHVAQQIATLSALEPGNASGVSFASNAGVPPEVASPPSAAGHSEAGQAMEPSLWDQFYDLEIKDKSPFRLPLLPFDVASDGLTYAAAAGVQLVDFAEDKQKELNADATKQLDGIPGLEPAAKLTFSVEEQATEAVGGPLKSLLGTAAQSQKLLINPIGQFLDSLPLAEQVPTSVGPNPLKLAHDAFNAAKSGGSVVDAVKHDFDPNVVQADAKGLGATLLSPYAKPWSEGKYAEAIGRGTFDLAGLVFGLKGGLKGAPEAPSAPEVRLPGSPEPSAPAEPGLPGEGPASAKAEPNAEPSAAPRELAFLSEADPARDVLGPAKQSHPQEIAQMREHLKELGVQVIERDNAMAYGPNPSAGKPGQLIIDPNASYSAWLHEYQHAIDDHAAGWSGMRPLFDNDIRWQREQAAYGKEIDLMESLGHHDVANELRALMGAERARIFGEGP